MVRNMNGPEQADIMSCGVQQPVQEILQKDEQPPVKVCVGYFQEAVMPVTIIEQEKSAGFHHHVHQEIHAHQVDGGQRVLRVIVLPVVPVAEIRFQDA